MADKKLQYIIELVKQGDASAAVRELERVETASKKTGSATGALDKSVKGLLAAYGALQGLGGALNEFLKADEAVQRLNGALKASGQYTVEYSQQLQNLAKSFQKLTTYDGDDVLNVIAKLAAFGANSQNIGQLTEAVLDLSTVLGKDLNRATMTVAKALQGNFDGFSELGIEVTKTAGRTQQFTEALDGMAKMSGGAAREAVKSLGGQFKQMQNEVGDAKEQLGKWIAQAASATAYAAEFCAELYTQNLPKKALDEQLFAHTQLRAAIEREIDAQEKLGRVSLETASKMRETLWRAFYTNSDIPRSASREKSAMQQVRSGLGSNPASPDAPAAVPSGPVGGVGYAYPIGPPAPPRERDYLEDIKDYNQVVGEMQDDARRAQDEAWSDYIENLKDYNAVVAEMQAEQNYAWSNFSENIKADLAGIKEAGIQAFSQGMARAIVDSFEQGNQSFEKFAKNFLKMIAEMIIQVIIFNTIKSVGMAIGFAKGGMTYKAAAGISMLNSPTFIPSHNVLAGEAGPELLTVLAKPRQASFGGVPGWIGNVGSQKTVVMAADGVAALSGGAVSGGAGGRASGEVLIRVEPAPEFRASIVQDSVKHARVQIVQDMSKDTPLSRSAKSLQTRM